MTVIGLSVLPTTNTKANTQTNTNTQKQIESMNTEILNEEGRKNLDFEKINKNNKTQTNPSNFSFLARTASIRSSKDVFSYKEYI